MAERGIHEGTRSGMKVNEEEKEKEGGLNGRPHWLLTTDH
jgi:hypothetical protein